MSSEKDQTINIEKVYAKDLKKEETVLLYINDKLEMTSKDPVFVEGFIEGVTKVSPHVGINEYSIVLSEENPVQDAMSWLYSKSGGMQIFSQLKQRIDQMSMVEILSI